MIKFRNIFPIHYYYTIFCCRCITFWLKREKTKLMIIIISVCYITLISPFSNWFSSLCSNILDKPSFIRFIYDDFFISIVRINITNDISQYNRVKTNTNEHRRTNEHTHTHIKTLRYYIEIYYIFMNIA